eukprot:scaffold20779_cov107-Isochrysis_galbana.AAC.1
MSFSTANPRRVLWCAGASAVVLRPCQKGAGRLSGRGGRPAGQLHAHRPSSKRKLDRRPGGGVHGYRPGSQRVGGALAQPVAPGAAAGACRFLQGWGASIPLYISPLFHLSAPMRGTSPRSLSLSLSLPPRYPPRKSQLGRPKRQTPNKHLRPSP